MKPNALTRAAVDMAALAQGAQIELDLARVKGARLRAEVEGLVGLVVAEELNRVSPTEAEERAFESPCGPERSEEQGMPASPKRKR